MSPRSSRCGQERERERERERWGYDLCRLEVAAADVCGLGADLYVLGHGDEVSEDEDAEEQDEGDELGAVVDGADDGGEDRGEGGQVDGLGHDGLQARGEVEGVRVVEERHALLGDEVAAHADVERLVAEAPLDGGGGEAEELGRAGANHGRDLGRDHGVRLCGGGGDNCRHGLVDQQENVCAQMVAHPF